MKKFNISKKIAIVFLCAVFARGAIPASGAPAIPAAPALTVPVVVEQPPDLIGAWSADAWRPAAAVSRFFVSGAIEDGARDTNQTVRVMCDNEWVYLRFDILHSDPERIQPRAAGHDGPVHHDDSVEIYLDPSGRGELCFHFQLNAAGVMAEQVIVKNKRDRSWDFPWKASARITESGWRAEVAIPLYLLAQYGDLDQVRMNLAVNRVLPIIDPSAVRVGETRASVVWAPTRTSFYEPENFGSVAGLADVELKTPYLAWARDAAAGEYEAVGGQYGYAITGIIRNYTTRALKLKLVAMDQPSGAPESEMIQELELAGREQRAFRVWMPVSAFLPRAAALCIKDCASGEVLQTIAVNFGNHAPVLSAWPGRSYYTTEKKARVICKISLPAAGLSNLSVAVRTPAGDVMAEVPASECRNGIVLGLDKLPAGSSELPVQMRNADGVVLADAAVVLTRRASRPGMEWKTDRVNGVLLDNEKPFFPFGAILSGTRAGDEDADAVFDGIAAAGFNTIVRWMPEHPENARAYMDLAARHGLKVVDRIENYAANNLTALKVKLHVDSALRAMPRAEKSKMFRDVYERDLPRMLLGIRNVFNHPNLIAYMTFDEPRDDFDQYVQGRDLYRKCNEIDGYHPTVVLYNPVFPGDPKMTDWCDILATDPYWIPPPGIHHPLASPKVAAHGTRITRRRADAIGKPGWVVLVADAWSACRKRAITPREQYCQTYLALINGAKGIIYFRCPVMAQASFDALAGLAREMKTLGSIALAPDLPQKIVYRPLPFDVANLNYQDYYAWRHYPDVPVALKTNPAGGYVLLAANTQGRAADVSYRISGLSGNGMVDCLFGRSQYVATNGMFSDRLEGFGVRAYRIGGRLIKAEDKSAEEFVVNVDARPVEDGYADEEIAPVTGRPGRRNLVINPSLEYASLPGMPDYYRLNYQPAIARIGASGDFGLDKNDAFHGKYSFKMTGAPGARRDFMFYLAPQTEKPRQFVFSLYMRADTNGVTVAFPPGFKTEGRWWEQKTKLTAAWRRYFISGVIQPGCDVYQSFGVSLLGAGTIWLDALQFEPGEQPTDFEP